MNSSYYRQLSQKLKNHPDFNGFLSLVRGKMTSSPLGPVNREEMEAILGGVQGSFFPFIVARLYELGQKGLLVILSTDKECEHLQDDLGRLDIPTEIWPGAGTAPYQPLGMNSPVFGQRMHLLSRLMRDEDFVLLSSLRAASGFLPPPKEIRPNLRKFSLGQAIDPIELARDLRDLGYMRVPKVTVAGEFALRGEVLDISLPGSEEGVRIGFAYDQIEDLRYFETDSQASTRKIQEFTLYPFREWVWTEESRKRLIKKVGSLPELQKAKPESFPWHLQSGIFEGEEFWYPLAFEASPATLFDYLPKNWTLFLKDYERLLNSEETMVKEYEGMYRKVRHENPVPRPERLLASLSSLEHSFHRVVRMPLLRDTKIPGNHRFHITTEGPRSFFGNIPFLREELAGLRKNGYTLLAVADSAVQKQRLGLILLEEGIQIEEGGPRSGFTLPECKFSVIHETEIFGRRKTIPKSLHKVKTQAIDSFVDLEVGDFIVHISHGIGRFLGIQRIIAGGTERDYIKLEYSDKETVFVPIEQVNLIQKYIGNQGADPRLDKIGGKSWEARKDRVRQKVQDLAEHLIDLYSKRKKSQGFPFPQDTEWQIQFESTFPFEETEDQIRCIEEVKADMEKPRPMDRLVCGDVGFGKTEIAMRAAFKTVTAGKQVAFLAPTTILAEQHFESLEERLEGYPIKVGMLSRFVAKADQKKILQGVKDGSIDILIGTHRIVQKDVLFKDLGLMIIDEEQRFGVKDKERLKVLKHSVDCLTLSATPIPRTLHMSLLKIRDMSVLKTPPYNRRPIETHVEAFHEEIVVKAIRKEVQRGGQVFYLHNRVETLEKVQIMLETLVPEVLVQTAHGQMGPKELEDIMHRFIHGGFHVLVATTIIENGINIPNVNTILIDRADMYGVSQLYQLRGRVGRSDRLAYAFLLYPGERSLSELAMKRLQIISDNTELGSGFKIALKDLEVRGAGNLLGAEQSGEIYAVGFDLYLRLLDEAVRKLMKAEAAARKILALENDTYPIDDEMLEIVEEQAPDTYLELDYTGFIPDTYISDSMEKMEVYKKISSIGTDAELDGIYGEMEDRFGSLPDEVLSLLSLAELRILCRRLSILSLRERRGIVEIEFGRMATINIQRLLEMIKTSGGAVKPVPSQPNKIRMESSAIGLKEKSEFIRGRLSQLLQ